MDVGSNMGTKLHSGKEKTGRLLRKASCALLAVLLVVAFVPVGVLSAFAKEVNAGGDQNKESSHDSVFANVGISPLASSATIVLKAQESGSLTIRNKWSSTIIISQSGYSDTEVKASQELSRNVAANEEISVKESSAGKTFRAWREDTYAFVRGAACAITSMPAMSAFTTDASGNRTGDLFFENFNAYGSITSLPKGSFNTSNITSVGKSFFIGFNYYGGLKELPQGSFNTSNIATIGDGFFYGFNYSGGLTSLPQGSFGINKHLPAVAFLENSTLQEA